MMNASGTIRSLMPPGRFQEEGLSHVAPLAPYLHPVPSSDVDAAPASNCLAACGCETFEVDLAGEMMGLRSYAIWLCRSRNLADDLIQETLVKAWCARDRFQSGTNLRAWCITILRNVFLSYKRRSWRSLPFPDEMVAELAAEHEELGHRLDLLALRNAIALLPRNQREAILLVGAGGASYIEAAEICACAVGTVKSRVSRARLRLAELLSDNRAGFNSNPNIEAEEVLNDLMEQVSQIKCRGRRESIGAARQNDLEYASAVYSEPAGAHRRALTSI